ncbi:MAG: hypothetical protein B6242_01840 [Anaerolineaceae bacterium 4572_78]|nr:MAG: hypothetical protein B6242_01840 [Anaerolineaceae bacterium 4572_78]
MSPTQTLASSKDESSFDDPRFELVDRALKRNHYHQDALIEVLYAAQESFGYLNKDLLTYIAQKLKLSLSWVYGVAGFYHYFSLEAQGEHSCVVCTGTACYVKRVEEIVTKLENEFGIKFGETTPDGKLNLQTVRCPGNCGNAPIVILDGEVWGRETPESTIERVRALVANSGGKTDE